MCVNITFPSTCCRLLVYIVYIWFDPFIHPNLRHAAQYATIFARKIAHHLCIREHRLNRVTWEAKSKTGVVVTREMKLFHKTKLSI